MRYLALAWGLFLAVVGAGQTRGPAFRKAPLPEPSVPAGAWYFGVGFGSIAYGDESECGCSAATVDVSGAFEGPRGTGFEYQLAFTQTTAPLLDHRINLFHYPELGKLGRAFGVYAGGGLVRQVNAGDAMSRGYVYGYGIRARAPLGGRGRTRIFADVGVSTARERFEFDRGWWGATESAVQRHVHSGLRVRLGVVW